MGDETRSDFKCLPKKKKKIFSRPKWANAISKFSFGYLLLLLFFFVFKKIFFTLFRRLILFTNVSRVNIRFSFAGQRTQELFSSSILTTTDTPPPPQLGLLSPGCRLTKRLLSRKRNTLKNLWRRKYVRRGIFPDRRSKGWRRIRPPSTFTLFATQWLGHCATCQGSW